MILIGVQPRVLKGERCLTRHAASRSHSAAADPRPATGSGVLTTPALCTCALRLAGGHPSWRPLLPPFPQAPHGAVAATVPGTFLRECTEGAGCPGEDLGALRESLQELSRSQPGV